MTPKERKLMLKLAQQLEFWFGEFWEGALGNEPTMHKIYRSDAQRIARLVKQAKQLSLPSDRNQTRN